MSADFEKTWLYAGEKQRGSQFDYADQAVLIMLTVKEVFHPTNRGAESFVHSLFRMMIINLPVPDHSTISKRSKNLKVNLPKKAGLSLKIVMYSTGSKIYGEGEWKVRMHDGLKRRTWRKLHVGANPKDGEIPAASLTENNSSDDQAVRELAVVKSKRPVVSSEDDSQTCCLQITKPQEPKYRQKWTQCEWQSTMVWWYEAVPVGDALPQRTW